MGFEDVSLDEIRRVMGETIFGLWNHLGGSLYDSKLEGEWGDDEKRRKYVMEYIKERFAKDPNGREYLGKREHSSISGNLKRNRIL